MNLAYFSPRKIYLAFLARFWRETGHFKKHADVLYRQTFARRINWKQPEDLNQWINWLAFNTDTSMWSILADKYRVREYVTEKGYSEHLVPLLKTWSDPEEMNFDSLPEKFVLKINNGAGDIILVKDKNRADLPQIKEYFRKLYRHPFGKDTAEPHYLRITPLILAEQMLDASKQEGNSGTLIDYKFWCFNGQVDRCFVCSDRSKDTITIDLYDAHSWKRIEEGRLVYSEHHLKAASPCPKPEGLEKMLEIASSLSKGYPQMRVDFYEVDNKVYFGEMTMTGAAGRTTSHSQLSLKEMGRLCEEAVKELGIK